MKKLYDILPSEIIKQNEPMKNHTTFRIGGPADYLVTPQSTKQLCDVIELARSENTPFFVMGNGSNLLVSDKGIRGIVIKTSRFDSIISKESTITAGAGALLSRVAAHAMKMGLTGLEFAQGIPGTLGGGVAMNAGAYGGELKNVVSSTVYLDESCNIKTLTDHKFGYRHSVFTDNPDWIILESTIELKHGKIDEITEKMNEYSTARKTKQPIELPSAGSVFKRPEGYFAGKLIDDCGLRGFSSGGASVSEKHCGFIVNNNNATAKDVYDLIEHIRRKVKEQFGVELETEVKLAGEW